MVDIYSMAIGGRGERDAREKGNIVFEGRHVVGYSCNRTERI